MNKKGPELFCLDPNMLIALLSPTLSDLPSPFHTLALIQLSLGRILLDGLLIPGI